MKKSVLVFLSITFLIFIYSCDEEDHKNFPENGLVAYYSFAGGKALYLSGNGNNGTISQATETNDRFGKSKEAFLFRNENDYIKVNNPGFLGNSEGTFVAWVKFNNLDHVQYIASVGDTSSIESYISFIRLDPSTETLGIYQREVGLANWVNGSTVINPDEYYHVAMLTDGTSWSIYVNGKKEDLTVKSGSNTGKWTGSLSGIDNFVIGNCIIKKPYTIPYLSGTIDEILLYNRALSEEEIKQIYNSGK